MSAPADDLVDRLTRLGATVATAESLTAGLVAATLADVPGASAVLRGGIIAYTNELKAELLGVDARLLAERGAVDGEVAQQMAAGVRVRLGAAYGLSTTGVAGPGPSEGKAAGTVYVAVAGTHTSRLRSLRLQGDRAAVRALTVGAALELLAEELGARRVLDRPGQPGPSGAVHASRA